MLVNWDLKCLLVLQSVVFCSIERMAKGMDCFPYVL